MDSYLFSHLKGSTFICLCLPIYRAGKGHATDFSAVHLLFRSCLLCRLMARCKHEDIGEQCGGDGFLFIVRELNLNNDKNPLFLRGMHLVLCHLEKSALYRDNPVL